MSKWRAPLDEGGQGGRFLGVERAAHRGDDLVGAGHRRRHQHLAHGVLVLRVVQALGDEDREVVLETEVVEAGPGGDQRQQRQDVEAELVAGMRRAHARPARRRSKPNAGSSLRSVASRSGQVMRPGTRARSFS